MLGHIPCAADGCHGAGNHRRRGGRTPRAHNPAARRARNDVSGIHPGIAHGRSGTLNPGNAHGPDPSSERPLYETPGQQPVHVHSMSKCLQ